MTVIGALIDILDGHGRTPLDIASSQIKDDESVFEAGFFRPLCCEMLLQLGADPNRVNKDGAVPLNHAGGDPDIVKVLLQHGADVDAGRHGVLMSAIDAGNVEVLKLYLENGVDCNRDYGLNDDESADGWENRDYSYPLKQAALPLYDRVPHPESTRKMINLLLDHGAKVDLPLDQHKTLIHFIFSRAADCVLQAFIDRPDLDYNLRDQQGRTVFLAACESDINNNSQFRDKYPEYGPAFRTLINSAIHGLRIDYLARDNKGRNMLHLILPKWDSETVTKLLSTPENLQLVHQKDNEGWTPFHLALKNRHFKAAADLVNTGGANLLCPDPNNEIVVHRISRWAPYHAEFLHDSALIDQYLSLGGNINAQNNKGETALHLHISRLLGPHQYTTDPDHFLLNTLDFFITRNADLGILTHKGETVLHYAADRKPAVVNAPLDEAAEEFNANLFSRLVELGCEPLQEDQMGRTALDVAAGRKHEKILELYRRKKG
jgi:ankyrin repeat protein